MGTLLSDSGVEFILSDAGVLAEGSMIGFIKGKFYNRCTRIHEILATVLEQKLYDRFLQDLPEKDRDSFQEMMFAILADPDLANERLSDSTVTRHLDMYNNYFKSVLSGSLGPTAQFWTIYIFLIKEKHSVS